MKILTLLNEKGGVGKTTLATHIAAGMAIRGYRVCLADADAQGHAGVSLGLAKEAGLYNLLVRDMSFREVLREVPKDWYLPSNASNTEGNLYVIPSNQETRSIATQISDAFTVVNRFKQLEGVFDLVVFDTSPTPSLLHGSIYLATDAIIYPTKCEYLSFDGLFESLTHRQRVEPARAQWGLGPIEVLGVVPMMFRAQTALHQENLTYLREQYGELVWNEIAMRTQWAEASNFNQLVYTYAPSSEATNEMWRIVDRVERYLTHEQAGYVEGNGR
ncbi:MAG: ParA family protein [Phototrophicaceae bacterium]